MAAFKRGSVLPLAVILVVTGWFGSTINTTASASERIPIRAASAAPGDTAYTSIPEFLDYALFGGRLIYFSTTGILYSQEFPDSPTGELQVVFFDDAASPQDLANTKPSFKVLDGRLIFQATRIDTSGQPARRTYRLDLEGRAPGVARLSPNISFDAVEHEDYLYGVRSVLTSELAHYPPCRLSSENLNTITRRPGVLPSDFVEDINYDGVMRCQRVLSMQSTPLGLLVSSRFAPIPRFTGGSFGELHLLADIQSAPAGINPSFWISPSTEIADLGLSPIETTGNPFVLGDSIYFDKQYSPWDPYFPGHPMFQEPGYPSYRMDRYNTSTGETEELDYRVPVDRVIYNNAAYWVDTFGGEQVLFRLRADASGPEPMQLSPNAPSGASNTLRIIGVHGDRLLFVADSGNGPDLHYLANDGETAMPLYVGEEVMATATQFRSDGDDLIFLSMLEPVGAWFFFHVRLNQPDKAVPGSGEPTTDIASGKVKVSLTFDGKTEASRPGVKFAKGEQVEVLCEVVNDTPDVLTDVEIRLKWQRYRGQSRMERVDVGGQCSGLTLGPGERARCSHAWKVRRGSREHGCAAATTRAGRSYREKTSATAYVKARR